MILVVCANQREFSQFQRSWVYGGDWKQLKRVTKIIDIECTNPVAVIRIGHVWEQYMKGKPKRKEMEEVYAYAQHYMQSKRG